MTTLDQEEIKKFEAMAEEWWDESGKFKPLHQLNPTRISYIKNKICDHFCLKKNQKQPLEDKKIIDIGCGGGLISEPFARMGAQMTGIDASRKNIEIAKIHAQKSDLKINYQQNLVEDLDPNQQYDAVFALEIIEHVQNIDIFIANCAKIVKKDGLLFISTINRTIKSLLTAKIAAEYILRWLPRGTHDYKKFLKPSEITAITDKNELELQEIYGFSYNIIKNEWNITPDDIDVNYIMVFKKK